MVSSELYNLFKKYSEFSRAVYDNDDGKNYYNSNSNSSLDSGILYNEGWRMLAVNWSVPDNITGNPVTVTTDNRRYFSWESGIDAAAYMQGDKLVISYRGTEPTADYLMDIVADAALTFNMINDQFNHADYFYKAVRAQYSNIFDSNIVITGHSLGGALAQIIGAKYGNTTYTYNAPGMQTNLAVYGLSNQSYSNITNLVVMNDYVGNLRAHVGDTYYIPPTPINDGSLMGALNNETHYSILDRYFNSNYAGQYGEIISKPLGFGTEEAWALWAYDVNNQVIGAVLRTQVGEDDLKNAVDILNTLESPLRQS